VSLGEFQLISRFFHSVGSQDKPRSMQDSDGRKDPYLEIGIGDDAAVISAIGNNQLAVSTDTLVESVHFPKGANPELLARRALRVNLSDMVAMGAQPKWFTLALTLPDVDEAWLESFSQGLKHDAEEFDCQLIGGDTTKGPLNIGIQIMGVIPEDREPLTRSGAEIGDLLVVTGNLGSAGAALQFDLNSFNPDMDIFEQGVSGQNFLKSYWLPQPRVKFVLTASEYIHAACDISDGLMADIGHLCEQSNLSAIIDLNKVPVSSELMDYDPEAKINALTAGDDYELCMAVSATDLEKLEELAGSHNVKISVVGQFQQSQADCHQVSVRDHQGEILEIKNSGYQHF